MEVDEKKPQNLKACLTHALNVDANNITKLHEGTRCSPENVNGCSDFSGISASCDTDRATEACDQAIATSPSVAFKDAISLSCEEIIDTSDECTRKLSKGRKRIGKSKENVALLSAGEKETVTVDDGNENETRMETSATLSRSSDKAETDDSLARVGTTLRPTTQEDRSSMRHEERNDARDEDGRTVEPSVTPSDVLIISNGRKTLNGGAENESKPAEYASSVPGVGPTPPPERKVKKFERQKSKPVPPPSPLVKISRDECDWDSLFDDNGDCLDPTLIEEVSGTVPAVKLDRRFDLEIHLAIRDNRHLFVF